MSATAKASKPARKKPGCRPGQIHAGSFRSGFDARRNIRQPSENKIWTDQLAEALAGHVPAAVRFLAESVADESKSDSIRMTAAQEILDRRFGKSVDRQAHLVLNQPPSTGQDAGKPPAALSNEELQRLSAQALAVLEATDTKVIEGEAELVSATLEHKSE